MRKRGSQVPFCSANNSGLHVMHTYHGHDLAMYVSMTDMANTEREKM